MTGHITRVCIAAACALLTIHPTIRPSIHPSNACIIAVLSLLQLSSQPSLRPAVCGVSATRTGWRCSLLSRLVRSALPHCCSGWCSGLADVRSAVADQCSAVRGGAVEPSNEREPEARLLSLAVGLLGGQRPHPSQLPLTSPTGRVTRRSCERAPPLSWPVSAAC